MKRKKAKKLADERYNIDYKGIIMNTLVSATSSLTATGLLNFVQSVPVSQMPVIFLVIFVAQILPKILVEYNKSYRVNQAKKQGFTDGFVTSGDDGGSTKHTTSELFFSLCESASYF